MCSRIQEIWAQIITRVRTINEARPKFTDPYGPVNTKNLMSGLAVADLGEGPRGPGAPLF